LTRRPSPALHLAVLKADRPLVQQLLADGADPHAVDGSGHTALMEALYNTAGTKARLPIVKLLVEAGASLAVRDRFGNGVLQLCASDPARVRALLKLGADPLERTGGETPLHRTENPEVVDILVQAGAPVDALDDHGCSPWLRRVNCLSGRRGAPDVRVLEALLAAGADPARVDSAGRDAWSHAGDNLALLGWLERKGLRPAFIADEQGLEGETALHRAAAFGWLAVVKRLLKVNVPVNVRLRRASDRLGGTAGATPLDLAKAAGHKAVVVALVAAGAQPGEPRGRAVILLATQQAGPALALLLRSRFADPAALLRGVPTEEGSFADEDYNYVEPLVVAEGLEPAEAQELAGAITAVGGLARVL
jgi:ankyrin repeat protein